MSSKKTLRRRIKALKFHLEHTCDQKQQVTNELGAVYLSNDNLKNESKRLVDGFKVIEAQLTDRAQTAEKAYTQIHKDYCDQQGYGQQIENFYTPELKRVLEEKCELQSKLQDEKDRNIDALKTINAMQKENTFLQGKIFDQEGLELQQKITGLNLNAKIQEIGSLNNIIKDLKIEVEASNDALKLQRQGERRLKAAGEQWLIDKKELERKLQLCEASNNGLQSIIDKQGKKQTFKVVTPNLGKDIQSINDMEFKTMFGKKNKPGKLGPHKPVKKTRKK